MPSRSAPFSAMNPSEWRRTFLFQQFASYTCMTINLNLQLKDSPRKRATNRPPSIPRSRRPVIISFKQKKVRTRSVEFPFLNK